MPLSLNDPRWHELRGSYGGTTDVVTWLQKALQSTDVTDNLLGDLINEVRHQGDTTTAMYAVAPHLITLARPANPELAVRLLSHAGLIYADAGGPHAVSCPTFLQDEFTAYAAVGAKMLAPLIPSATDFDSFKYAVAALAGFMGHYSFGRLLTGFDLYKGEFHHAYLDGPFPPEI